MLIVIIWTNWYIIFVFPIISVMLFYLFKLAVIAYREGNRIEAITKSPLLNFINESFNGVTTVRAFNKEKEFQQKSYELLDRNILAN